MITSTIIKDVQTELSEKLGTLLVGDALPGKAMYAYRTLPGDLAVEIGITNMGRRNEDNVTGGDGYSILYSVFVFAQHLNDAETLELAENALGEIESLILYGLDQADDALYTGDNYDYLKFEWSMRPPAPRDVPNVRHGLIYLRAYI